MMRPSEAKLDNKGVDFENLDYTYLSVKTHFYKFILPTCDEYQDLTTDENGKNFLADHWEQVKAKSKK